MVTFPCLQRANSRQPDRRMLTYFDMVSKSIYAYSGGADACARRSCAGRSSRSSSDGRSMKPWAMSHFISTSARGFAILDAFGDDRAAERMGEGDGRLDHQQVAAVVAHRLDEALVDLDFARRDFLEIVEGRQAGAIIVDRDADARGRAAASADRDRHAVAGQRGGLGQLERQAVRRRGRGGRARARHRSGRLRRSACAPTG